MTNKKIKKIIFYGGTGQAKVMKAIADFSELELLIVFDDTEDLVAPFDDIPLCNGNQIENWISSRDDIDEIGFSITIGNPHGKVRLLLSEKLKSLGLTPVTLIHPSAIIAKNALIGEGCQIHAGTIIGEEVQIGNQCIINTKSSIDHETILSDGVELTPNVTLCGNIKIGLCSTIYSSATVLPHLSIGDNVIVGAGSLVTKDITNGSFVYGVPAKLKKKEK